MINVQGDNNVKPSTSVEFNVLLNAELKNKFIL